jgi:hypothetical protein
MAFESEVNVPMTGVNPQGGIELSDPTSNVPTGPLKGPCLVLVIE